MGKHTNPTSFTPRPNLYAGDSANAVHKSIVESINLLLKMEAASPSDDTFQIEYCRFLELFGRYQREVLRQSPFTLSCAKNCSACCYHWVEDVYSFEAIIIASYVRKHMPLRISEIIDSFKRDVAEMERLDAIVTSRLMRRRRNPESAGIDSVDLLLASFYQLRRPCAFLEEDGSCGIYEVRPLTCRIYMSFSLPEYCDPDYINVSDTRTYLLDLEEEASDLLDKLHVKYDVFGNDLGLRSLMLKCLSGSDVIFPLKSI
jgi:Fe-S-cluster containining protein